jgi:hypothetical protein
VGEIGQEAQPTLRRRQPGFDRPQQDLLRLQLPSLEDRRLQLLGHDLLREPFQPRFEGAEQFDLAVRVQHGQGRRHRRGRRVWTQEEQRPLLHIRSEVGVAPEGAAHVQEPAAMTSKAFRPVRRPPSGAVHRAGAVHGGHQHGAGVRHGRCGEGVVIVRRDRQHVG